MVLIQVLKQLQSRYNIEYDFRTVLNLQSDMYPALGLWNENALRDGKYLANLYELYFPEDTSKKPDFSETENMKITAQLLHWELQPGYLDRAQLLFSAYWQNDKNKVTSLLDKNVTSNVECYGHHLSANQAMLKRCGHYLTGMLHYGNEWYWGLDRLQYLEQRLNDLNVNKVEKQVSFNLSQLNFCQHVTPQKIAISSHNLKPIIMYWSLRSPYSYLAIIRATQLAKHYKTKLVIKPVLPMVMRRMSVPKDKTSYIARDVKRESLLYGIEFGRIADPLGAGVERCYSVYQYALSKGKGNELLQAWATSVWSQGIDSATDSGVKKIIEKVGLPWDQVKPLLGNSDWRVWAQENLAELYGQNLWGVPSLIYGGCKAFGQDRIDMIESAIADDLNAGTLKP
jgi:2-hydroxychromene-2-carboxylate isomerase